jgi:hypothetical protein
MRTSFVSSLRCVAAVATLIFGCSVTQAQTVFSDNFQSYSTTVAPIGFTYTYPFVSNTVVNGMNPAEIFSITNNLARNTGTFAAPQTQHPAIATSEPNSAYSPLQPFYDHTFGDNSGLYLAINGGSATTIYQTVSSFAVIPNTDYTFSVYLNSWTNANNLFGRIEVRLQGNDTSLTGNFLDAPPVGSYSSWGQAWTQRTFVFNSGTNTSFNLNILNVNTEIDGNDYSVDDISVFAVAIPEPGVIALGSIGAAGFGAAIYSKIRARRRRKMLAQQRKLEAAKA